MILLKPLGPVRFRTAFRTTVIGFTALFLLPGRVGEILRPYLLARQEGLKATSTFATVIVERLLDMTTVLLLFACALPVAGVDVGHKVRVAGVVAAVGAVGAMALLFLFAGHPERLGRLAGRLGRRLPRKMADALARVVQTFAEGLAVMRSPAHLAAAGGLVDRGVAVDFARASGSPRIAFDLTVSFVGSFIVVGYLAVGVSVPTPGGAGGFHYFYQAGADELLRREPRRGGRGGDRPACRVVRAGHHRRAGVHVAGWTDARQAEKHARRSAGGGDARGSDRWSRLMKCPYCGHLSDKVVDSRESKEGEVIRRRRECLECGRRFTSYERIDEIPYMVVKKDGRRERFERQKLVAGLLKACEKRPVSIPALEAIADKIEAQLQETPEREIATEEIGATVMHALKHLDKVAFVRFASVYRNFRDLDEFKDELNALLRTRE